MKLVFKLIELTEELERLELIMKMLEIIFTLLAIYVHIPEWECQNLKFIKYQDYYQTGQNSNNE